MALKKPLVQTSGQIEQLQSGDYLQTQELPQLINGNAGTIPIGTPVYVTTNDTVDKAKADAVGTVNTIGLVADVSIAAAATGSVQVDGILVATTGQWDSVTGGSGGLVANSIYYLDPATAGKITATAPSTVGQFVAPIGIAISTTEMKISIGRRIKL